MKKRYLIIAAGIILFLMIDVFLLYRCNILPHMQYTNQNFNISTYVSSHDQDEDGIDDQTDILNGARAYIATKSKYKSKYYESGYPDDAYGVCTDVVGFAMLSAGYDLQRLVGEDINLHGEMYDIEQTDPKIDFRRVRNLKIYLDNNAISLTTDIHDMEQWQGGDIVTFKSHIGIVSDKRNRKGISFIIHHAGSMQLHYEEDILEKQGDITGHYRIS